MLPPVFSAGGAVENTATELWRILNEKFGGIGRIIKWVMMLGILVLIVILTLTLILYF